MLTSPNQGSEILDVFGEFGLYEMTMGPAAHEFGTGGIGFMSHFGAVGSCQKKTG